MSNLLITGRGQAPLRLAKALMVQESAFFLKYLATLTNLPAISRG